LKNLPRAAVAYAAVMYGAANRFGEHWWKFSYLLCFLTNFFSSANQRYSFFLFTGHTRSSAFYAVFERRNTYNILQFVAIPCAVRQTWQFSSPYRCYRIPTIYWLIFQAMKTSCIPTRTTVP
jgi:hypothetical protein